MEEVIQFAAAEGLILLAEEVMTSYTNKLVYKKCLLSEVLTNSLFSCCLLAPFRCTRTACMGRTKSLSPTGKSFRKWKKSTQRQWSWSPLTLCLMPTLESEYHWCFFKLSTGYESVSIWYWCFFMIYVRKQGHMPEDWVCFYGYHCIVNLHAFHWFRPIWVWSFAGFQRNTHVLAIWRFARLEMVVLITLSSTEAARVNKKWKFLEEILGTDLFFSECVTTTLVTK